MTCAPGIASPFRRLQFTNGAVSPESHNGGLSHPPPILHLSHFTT
jgi:hypothetical protein